jgi:hypothetical protein
MDRLQPMAGKATAEQGRLGYTYNSFYIPGIVSSSYGHTPMRLTLEATQYRGLNYEIHESDGDGLIKLHVFRNDPLAEATTIIDITKQFSMIEEIAESQGNPPYRETCKVEMEYIEPAGIWFPRRALLERYEGKP